MFCRASFHIYVYDDDNDVNDDNNTLQCHVWCVLLQMLFFFLKQQLFYFSPQRPKQKMALLTAKLNSFRQIGWILLRKECGVKFEYHQGENMDGWIPKGRVQIKPDRCSYERYIWILDQKSSRQCHSKDTWFCIHRQSRTQFLLGCLILVCCCEP